MNDALRKKRICEKNSSIGFVMRYFNYKTVRKKCELSYINFDY